MERIAESLGTTLKMYVFHGCINALTMYHALNIVPDVRFLGIPINLHWYFYLTYTAVLTLATMLFGLGLENARERFIQKNIGRDYDLVQDIMNPGFLRIFLLLVPVLLGVHYLAEWVLSSAWVHDLMNHVKLTFKETLTVFSVWLTLFSMCVILHYILVIITGCIIHIVRINIYRKMGYEYEWD